MSDNLYLKQQLDERQLAMLQSEFNNKKKSKVVMWLLWFFLGGLGGHRFYLGDTGYAVGMLLVTLLVGWFTFFLPTFIWVIIDAFLINGRLEQKNREIEEQLIHKIKQFNG
ncbi:hypothetical protein GCM10010965_23620 [Caldalkalibacillus thermarum]|uniref:TM2 domain-containing protein n=1 Tax=Caldalkalibacillus thermarum TaxID=296745 RepID=UPI0016678D3D|nr:TM2 domain-containing protein [Caldalkalibacillus thermarum]GGK30062.1 hypothetical protein GCM10010965_23620 [Caldalkalibacillus thermarum]